MTSWPMLPPPLGTASSVLNPYIGFPLRHPPRTVCLRQDFALRPHGAACREGGTVQGELLAVHLAASRPSGCTECVEWVWVQSLLQSKRSARVARPHCLQQVHSRARGLGRKASAFHTSSQLPPREASASPSPLGPGRAWGVNSSSLAAGHPWLQQLDLLHLWCSLDPPRGPGPAQESLNTHSVARVY